MQECLFLPPGSVPVCCLASWVFIFMMYCCLICLANLAGLSHGMLNISESVPYIILERFRFPSSSTLESFRLSKVNTLKARSTSFQLKTSVRKQTSAVRNVLYYHTVQGQWGGGRLVSPPERQKSHAIMHVDLTLHMGTPILQQISQATNNKKRIQSRYIKIMPINCFIDEWTWGVQIGSHRLSRVLVEYV